MEGRVSLGPLLLLRGGGGVSAAADGSGEAEAPARRCASTDLGWSRASASALEHINGIDKISRLRVLGDVSRSCRTHALFILFRYQHVIQLWLMNLRGFPAANDGKPMDRVLCIMQFCVIFFPAAMLLFFAVQGDSMKLQAICTLGLLVFYKLLPSGSDCFQPSLLEGMQTVNNSVDGPTDYEVFSELDLDWNLYQS
ncbi:hypothetical protein BRADI_3g53210v3 [Brachypodium distachyon]|uniref:Uncharacterized protein n=1 Tax=Brachypodium distachyon TaxID=15368 RepID=I1ID60_BRADI|nr:hypothetical protein BRADI_3g53210v3 [Brachypodium distachyon]